MSATQPASQPTSPTRTASVGGAPNPQPYAALRVAKALSRGAFPELRHERNLLCHLLHLADDHRVDIERDPVIISLSQLEAATGFHRGTILRWRGALCRQGYLTVEASQHTGTACKYRFTTRLIDLSRGTTPQSGPVAWYDTHQSHGTTPTSRMMQQDHLHGAHILPIPPEPIILDERGNDSKSESERIVVTPSPSTPSDDSLQPAYNLIEQWHLAATGQLIMPSADKDLRDEWAKRIATVPTERLADLDRAVRGMIDAKRNSDGRIYRLAAIQVQLTSMISTAIKGDPDTPSVPLWKRVRSVLDACGETCVTSDDLALALRRANIAPDVVRDDEQFTRVLAWARRRWPESDSELPARLKRLLDPASIPKRRLAPIQTLHIDAPDTSGQSVEPSVLLAEIKQRLRDHGGLPRIDAAPKTRQVLVPLDVSAFNALNRDELLAKLDPELASELPESLPTEEVRRWVQRAMAI